MASAGGSAPGWSTQGGLRSMGCQTQRFSCFLAHSLSISVFPPPQPGQDQPQPLHLPLPNPSADADTSPCLFARCKGARSSSSPSHPALIAEISGLGKPQGRRLGIYPSAWCHLTAQLQQVSLVPHNQGQPVPAPTSPGTPEILPGDAHTPHHPQGQAASLPSMLLGSLSRVLLLQRTPSPLPSIQT